MKITIDLPDDLGQVVTRYTEEEISMLVQRAILQNSKENTRQELIENQLSTILTQVGKILVAVEPSASPKEKEKNPFLATSVFTPDTSGLDFSSLMEMNQDEDKESAPTDLKSLKDFLKGGS